MGNDNHANYAKIGLTVIIGIVAVIGTLIYLGGMHGRDELFIETCYDKPVNGLSSGSAVNFRGVKVGEVREIGFIGDKYDVKGADNPRIYILMALDNRILGLDGTDRVLFRERVAQFVDKLGLRATVTASGITGLSRIELDFNRLNPPAPPVISWTPREAYVPPKVSLLDDFSDAATKVMNQINRMDMTGVWSNVNAAVESLSRAMSSAQVMLETRQADLERMMDDVSAAAASVRDFAAEVKRNPSLLVRERVPQRLEETE